MAHNIYFLHFDLTKSLTNQLDLIKLKYILSETQNSQQNLFIKPQL